MGRYVGTKPIADALVAAGLIENPDTVKSVTITADAEEGVMITVLCYGDSEKVADALLKLTEVGYRMVREESETSDAH